MGLMEVDNRLMHAFGGLVMSKTIVDVPEITRVYGIYIQERREKAQKYKKMVTSKHNLSRESFLPTGSYKKLHSYTHLLNGFAVDAKYEKDGNVVAAIRR